MTAAMDRRSFLAAGAAAGALVVGIPRVAEADADAMADTLSPAAFLEVSAAGVRIHITKTEMGQAVTTALPMLVADELDVALDAVTIRQADLDPRFGNQGTGGSGSIRFGYEAWRLAGAQARAMLVQAAATRLGVEPSALSTAGGAVRHADGRRLAYGDLAAAAAALPVPANPPRKPDDALRLIGTSPPRVEVPAKVAGRTRYGIDTRVPGQRYAALVRPPMMGAVLMDAATAAAAAAPGVLDVLRLPPRSDLRGLASSIHAGGAVAVIATSSWAALEGAKRVEAQWQMPAGAPSSATIVRLLEERVRQAGGLGRNDGDVDAALTGAHDRHEATYVLPYLAHATLEPQNCTAEFRAGRCEIWAPTQTPARVRTSVAAALGIRPDDVTVHITQLGGGFGRRLLADYAEEAAIVSRAAGVPVQLVWSRQDDFRHGFHRPASVHLLRGALDRRGHLTGWFHRIATPSITGFHGLAAGGRTVDPQVLDGAELIPYDVAHARIESALVQTPVPLCWWRSVYNSQNAFANEVFADELARRAGADPVEWRLRHAADARFRAVLEKAATESGWGGALAAGRARGVAVHRSFGTTVAEIAEISAENGRPRVHRVTCVVDCGRAVHPDTVAGQMEGGIIFGLSAALGQQLTLEGGVVQEASFADFPLVRMREAPRVDVHIVPSREAPGGVGEPSTPPVAPAVANAWFELQGERVRRLPFAGGVA